MTTTTPSSDTEVDICLLLEGTYPYVRGGVSAWIDRLIQAFDDLTFAIVLFGGKREDFETPRYALPANVVHLETHFLSDAWTPGRPRLRSTHTPPLEESETVHEWFRAPRDACPAEPLQRLVDAFTGPSGFSLEDFLYGREVWDRIRATYLERANGQPFIDYFWTVRIIHAPLFKLGEIARTAPRARVYHAISTGYAGLLGVFIQHLRHRPFILTEHGIYTKERKIDLTNAEWIKDVGASREDDLGYTRRLWIRFFEGLGRLTYQAADPIIALYEGNRQRQIQDGAPAERTRVIPNGIDLGRFERALHARAKNEIPKVAGLIGRVVSIKDIKTFIRAMRTVVQRVPDAEGWIIGPADEDPDYAAECEALTKSLGLVEKVRFLGFQKVDDMLPKLGLTVLSSISEAMPLVVVEGFAAGVPAVTTDVGACREMIEGMDDEDRALGAAGAVVDIADPEALARAISRLLSDADAWRRAQAAGLARVRRLYAEPTMVERYRAIYDRALEGQSAWQG